MEVSVVNIHEYVDIEVLNLIRILTGGLNSDHIQTEVLRHSMYGFTLWDMSGPGAIMGQTWSRDHAKPYIYTEYLNIEVMVSIPQNRLYARYDEIGILTKLTRVLFVILDLKSSILESRIQTPLRYDPKGTEIP